MHSARRRSIGLVGAVVVAVAGSIFVFVAVVAGDSWRLHTSVAVGATAVAAVAAMVLVGDRHRRATAEPADRAISAVDLGPVATVDHQLFGTAEGRDLPTGSARLARPAGADRLEQDPPLGALDRVAAVERETRLMLERLDELDAALAQLDAHSTVPDAMADWSATDQVAAANAAATQFESPLAELASLARALAQRGGATALLIDRAEKELGPLGRTVHDFGDLMDQGAVLAQRATATRLVATGLRTRFAALAESFGRLRRGADCLDGVVDDLDEAAEAIGAWRLGQPDVSPQLISFRAPGPLDGSEQLPAEIDLTAPRASDQLLSRP